METKTNKEEDSILLYLKKLIEKNKDVVLRWTASADSIDELYLIVNNEDYTPDYDLYDLLAYFQVYEISDGHYIGEDVTVTFEIIDDDTIEATVIRQSEFEVIEEESLVDLDNKYEKYLVENNINEIIPHNAVHNRQRKDFTLRFDKERTLSKKEYDDIHRSIKKFHDDLYEYLNSGFELTSFPITITTDGEILIVNYQKYTTTIESETVTLKIS